VRVAELCAQLVGRLTVDLRTRFPDAQANLTQTSVLGKESSFWALGVTVEGQSWGSVGVRFEPDDPTELSAHKAQQELTLAYQSVIDNVWPYDDTDPWPLCPKHGDHPLQPRLLSDVGSWVCRLDDSVAVPLGSLEIIAGTATDPQLLGGAASPLGISIGFIEASFAMVLEAHTEWWRELELDFSVSRELSPFPACLDSLLPLQTPPNRVLLIAHGRWTCHLTNPRSGGDSVSAVGHLSRLLDVHGVLASHRPRSPVGHASTQFEYFGPEGEPPLQYIRSLAAHAEDGRWSWHASGAPLPFEDEPRYSARLIRQRFDRDMLITYLGHLGIRPDDPAAFGPAALISRD
jgi:hypothetical protein